MMMRSSLLGILLMTSACALSAAGEKVVVSDPSGVGSCKQLGMVSSSPPYLLPGDDQKQMRSATAELGGNTLVVTHAAIVGSSRGVAYDCKR